MLFKRRFRTPQRWLWLTLALIITLILAAIFPPSALARPATKQPKPHDSLGVMLVDTQQWVFDWAQYTTPDLPAIAARAEGLINLARAKQLPMWITYEASKEGYSAMPPALEAAAGDLPRFVKFYFNAVRHPELADMVRASGITQVVLAGAETDVCVYQTALGLRELGLEVYLLRDTTFSSTHPKNLPPTLTRLEQAGVQLITYDYLQQSLASGSTLKPQSKPSIKPLDEIVKHRQAGDLASVVVNFQQSRIDSVQPKNKEALLSRLRHMFFFVDMFYLSHFYMVNDAGLEHALPPQYELPLNASEFEKTGDSLSSITGLTERLKADGIKIVALSGILTAHELKKLANDFQKAGFEVYLVQDALLSPDAEFAAVQRKLYDKGVIPTNYKMLFYELRESVYPPDQRDTTGWNWEKIGRAFTTLPWIESLAPIEP